MKRKTAAAATALVMTAALSGAAAAPGVAGEDRALHTKRLVLNQISIKQLGHNSLVGADKVRSRATGEVVGYDSLTIKFDAQTDTATVDVALALRGGIIVGRVKAAETSDHFEGRILTGTGKYKGIEGTITGREPTRNVYVTLRYRL
jgi:hypothetical protein